MSTRRKRGRSRSTKPPKENQAWPCPTCISRVRHPKPKESPLTFYTDGNGLEKLGVAPILENAPVLMTSADPKISGSGIKEKTVPTWFKYASDSSSKSKSKGKEGEKEPEKK